MVSTSLATCRTVTVQGSASLRKERQASEPPSWSSRQCQNTTSFVVTLARNVCCQRLKRLPHAKKKSARIGYVYRAHRVSQKLRLLVSGRFSCIRGTYKVRFSPAVEMIIDFTLFRSAIIFAYAAYRPTVVEAETKRKLFWLTTTDVYSLATPISWEGLMAAKRLNKRSSEHFECQELIFITSHKLFWLRVCKSRLKLDL